MPPETNRVTLFRDTEKSCTIEEAAVWLREIADQVPPEYRDSSVFEIELKDDYYGGSTLTFQGYYDRPETDEEMNQREHLYAERIRQEAEAAAARERAFYLRLKAKYEG